MSKINKHIKNNENAVKEINDTVNLKFNITNDNIFDIIKNQKEYLYLNDFNTNFEKKKKNMMKILLITF